MLAFGRPRVLGWVPRPRDVIKVKAPVAAWQAPGDPRRAITLDRLLRMQSGLELGDSLTASFSTAWDTSARMVFNEPEVELRQRQPGDPRPDRP